MFSDDEKRAGERRPDQGRHLVDWAADPMLVLNDSMRVIQANRPAAELFGRASIVDLSAAELLADGSELSFGLEAKSWRSRLPLRGVLVDALQPGGTRVPVEISLGPVNADGTILVVARETMPRRPAVTPAHDLDERYKLLFDHNLAGVYRCTLDGRIFECNESCAQMLGYTSRDELLGKTDASPYLEQHEREWLFGELQKQGRLTRFEVCMRKADGTPVWVLQNISLIRDGDRDFIEGTMFDVTARRLAEEQIAYQANYDLLTGLPNPTLLQERLTMALDQSDRSGRYVTVMFLDLDHFKAINDTLSHRIGDQLLQLVAYRLQNCLREYDTVARLGGDEFTIILQHVKSREDAAHIAGKILQSIAEPFLLDGREFFMTASAGIALSGIDGGDAETLLRNADVAMYRAKESGRNTFEFFGQSSGEKAAEKFELENDLRRALQRGEFRLHFQPQIDSLTGKVLCMEALIRWYHPTRGLVPPNAFIPIAEEVGLIIPIGEWVLEHACTQAQNWRLHHGWNLRVAVNLSPRQFHQKDLPLVIRRVLDKTGLPAEYLELEITESNAMQNPEMAIKTLAELKAMGLRISIDDFGTGYSSLSHLRRFPIDALKIDQSFVHDLETNENDAAIVSAVIAMAHKLKLTVIAEGVETKVQSEFLRAQQCEQMQGFLFSMPRAVEDLADLMRELEPEN